MKKILLTVISTAWLLLSVWTQAQGQEILIDATDSTKVSYFKAAEELGAINLYAQGSYIKIACPEQLISAVMIKARNSSTGFPPSEPVLESVQIGQLAIDGSEFRWRMFGAEISCADSIAFEFINDFYNGENNTDRNVAIDSIKFIITQIDTFKVDSSAVVTVSWQPNTEEDILLYKLIYGVGEMASIPHPDTSYQYIPPNGLNTVSVAAEDTAGNVSPYSSVDFWVQYAQEPIPPDTTAPARPKNVFIKIEYEN